MELRGNTNNQPANKQPANTNPANSSAEAQSEFRNADELCASVQGRGLVNLNEGVEFSKFFTSSRHKG